MNEIIKSINCLPIILIIIILISLKHVDGYNKQYLIICMISQILALVGIYINNLTLIGITHILYGIGFILGSLFLKNKIVNIVIIIKLLLVIYTRHVRGNCMYDDYSKKYMNKVPLNDNFGGILFNSFLIFNMYNFLVINKLN